VFQAFRRFTASLEGIRAELVDVGGLLSKLCRIQEDQGPATARLEKLELSRFQFEAMCEGLLQKAEGKLRAANNAEARERANKKSYEHLLDPLAEEGVEPETPGRHPDSANDVGDGEEERVSALRLDVAPNNKALAQRAKFGLT